MSDHNLAEALRTGLEAAQELLAIKREALGDDYRLTRTYWEAERELQAALVEAEQQAGEAVSVFSVMRNGKGETRFDFMPLDAAFEMQGGAYDLFAHQQQSLSDEQIKALRPLPFSNAELDRLYANIPPTAQKDARSREAFKRIARWIESAHGITKDTKAPGAGDV